MKNRFFHLRKKNFSKISKWISWYLKNLETF